MEIMRPVETIPGMGDGGGINENDGRDEFKHGIFDIL
jgi:hypothetical protein